MKIICLSKKYEITFKNTHVISFIVRLNCDSHKIVNIRSIYIDFLINNYSIKLLSINSAIATITICNDK